MAELMPIDFVGNFQRAYANAAEQRRAQDMERRRNQLAGLASQAYAAPEEQRAGLIQQAVGIDPESGFGLDKQLRAGDDAREAQLLNTARMIDAAPEGMKNAIFQQVRPRIAAHLPGLPDAYNEQVGQGIKAFIASRAGGSDAAVQSRFVGEDGTVYALMRDSTVKPLMGPDGRPLKADPRTQIIEGAGGYYGVDQRSLRATPVQVGGAQPQASAPPPQRMPEDAITAQANEMIRAGLPEAQVEQWMRYQHSRPQYVGSDTPAQPQQLQPTGPTPPAGFRWNADRSGLERIPGGPADEPAPTAQDFAKDEMAMRKELADLNKDDQTIVSAFSKVNAAARNPSAQNDLALIFAYMKMLDPGSVVREGEFANAQNAAGIPDRIANVYNRALRGERLNEQQRMGFVSSARDLYNGAIERVTDRTRQQAETAEQYGFDPVRATGSQQGSPQYRQRFDRAGQLLQEARQAIQSGKDPAAVRKRLIEMGFSHIAGRL